MSVILERFISSLLQRGLQLKSDIGSGYKMVLAAGQETMVQRRNNHIRGFFPAVQKTTSITVVTEINFSNVSFSIQLKFQR